MSRRVVAAILSATALILFAFGAWVVWDSSTNSKSGSASQSAPDAAPELVQGRLPAVIAPLAPGEPPTSAEVQALWANVESESHGEWDAWVLVQDADTGKVIYESGVDTPAPLASTTKILAAFTALSYLDPTATLATGVSRSGSQLYLWGEGDLLLAPGHGDRSNTYGHAGIEDIADQVAAAVGTGTFTLTYQDSLFGTAKRWPAWAEQDEVEFAGDIAPFAINTGRVDRSVWAYVDDSARDVAETLAHALDARGVHVTSVEPGKPPLDATQVAQVESASIQDQIRDLLARSDNTMTEQYCHLAAHAQGQQAPTFESAVENMKQTLQRAGVDLTGAKMNDCSGLDATSRIPPRALAQTLLASLKSDGPESALTRLLPIAAVNGSLAGRLEGTAAAGTYQAKTGYLGIASTIAGIGTTSSGATLVVIAGSSNVPGDGAWETTGFIDDFLAQLFAL